MLPPLAERKKAKLAGVEPDGPPVTWHTLRRMFVSHLILDLKLDPVQVSKQVGHAEPSITQNEYADLFDRARHHDEIRRRCAGARSGRRLRQVLRKERVATDGEKSVAADTPNVAFLHDSATGGDG